MVEPQVERHVGGAEYQGVTAVVASVMGFLELPWSLSTRWYHSQLLDPGDPDLLFPGQVVTLPPT